MWAGRRQGLTGAAHNLDKVAYTCVILSPRCDLQTTARVHGVRPNSGNCLCDVFRRESASKEKLWDKFPHALCDFPVNHLARAALKIARVGIQENRLHLISQRLLGFELILNAQRLD